MALGQENRYNWYMIGLKNIALIFSLSIMISSCATMDSMFSSDSSEGDSEVKELNLNKRLQIAIPIPEDSKYLTDKTIIFGEGERFTGVLYLLHDIPADEVVSFYRINMRDDGWSEIAIVRSDFILLNFDKEDRFATIKVNRKFLDSSSSEITIGPKTDTTINRSLHNIDSNNSTESEEPFTIQ